jgi:hypothetical protein
MIRKPASTAVIIGNSVATTECPADLFKRDSNMILVFTLSSRGRSDHFCSIGEQMGSHAQSAAHSNVMLAQKTRRVGGRAVIKQSAPRLNHGWAF